VAVAIGAYLAEGVLRVPHEDDLQLYVEGRRLYADAHQQTSILSVVALFIGVLLFLLLAYRKPIFERWGFYHDWGKQLGTALLVCLFAFFVALFFAPIEWLQLSRAPLIPLLLGGWVPLLGWLANKGRIYHAPFIILLFVFLEILTLAGNNHDIRTLFVNARGEISADTALDGPGIRRKRLDEKIEEWRKANGCPQTGGCEVRPIVVAASGGASRAGFFTAAVLGTLIDETSNRPRYRRFRDQLFAISSVSGSSTGAPFFVAALKDSENAKAPCDDSSASPLVFYKSAPQGWRRCMEQLLSGDFLSSTMVAYIYKDALRGLAAILKRNLGIYTPDRAATLEIAWEEHYCRSTSNTCKTPHTGLDRPFLSLAGHIDSTPDGKWVPLLFFNTTDVDTGRRVVVSSVPPYYVPRGQDAYRRLLLDAYDLHHLIADDPDTLGGRESDPKKHGAQPRGQLTEDIRLSTAASLSARFPFISPPGNVRNQRRGLVGRIVDGGYFENFGATTALEIVHALRADDLSPFVVEITNDPELLVPDRVQYEDRAYGPDRDICWVSVANPVCGADPPVIEVTDSRIFSGVRGPLSGVLGSRSAHGSRALRQLAYFAGYDEVDCPINTAPSRLSFVHILVSP
jgi:hypothetical protein